MQLMSALQYLQYAHDQTFRDLRAENVRLDWKMNITLGHFVSGDSVPSPELVMEQEPTPAVMIWSLGVLLFDCVRQPAVRGPPSREAAVQSPAPGSEVPRDNHPDAEWLTPLHVRKGPQRKNHPKRTLCSTHG
jgi:hypothetical protein